MGFKFDHSDIEKIEWIKSLSDINGGNYGNGQVNFNTKTYMGKDINYHDMTLETPYIVSSGPDLVNLFTAATAPNVSFKNGLAQLISKMKIKMNGKYPIQNSENLDQYAAITQMINDSVEWQRTHGSLFHLGSDTYNSNDGREFLFSTTAIPILSTPITITGGTNALTGTAAVGAGVAGTTTIVNSMSRNPAYNKGFATRINFLKGKYIAPAGALGGYFELTLSIPLKLISGFIAALNEPLINVYFEITAGFIVSGNTDGKTCLMADAAAIAQCPAPVSTLCAQDQRYKHTSTTLKLWLPEVFWTAEAQVRRTAAINSGLVKTVTFWDTKSYKNTRVNNVNNADLEFELTPGISQPMRLWTTIFPLNSMNVATSPSPCMSTGSLNSMNLLIDGKKFYTEDVERDFEFYEMLRKECYNAGLDYQTGALVSYADFADRTAGLHRYYVSNISKFINNKADVTAPVSLKFIGKLYNPGSVAYEIWHHIEYEVTVAINESNYEVTVINTL